MAKELSKFMLILPSLCCFNATDVSSRTQHFSKNAAQLLKGRWSLPLKKNHSPLGTHLALLSSCICGLVRWALSPIRVPSSFPTRDSTSPVGSSRRVRSMRERSAWRTRFEFWNRSQHYQSSDVSRANSYSTRIITKKAKIRATKHWWSLVGIKRCFPRGEHRIINSTWAKGDQISRPMRLLPRLPPHPWESAGHAGVTSGRERVPRSEIGCSPTTPRPCPPACGPPPS